MSIKKCKIIELPLLNDDRGDLTFIENNKHIPFSIKRIYYLYNNHLNLIRGRHAHKNLHQLFIAISGSFDVFLNDGKEDTSFKLDKKNVGLYVPKMIWRELKNFSQDSVCLVLASDLYKEDDYIRDYDKFLISSELES
jgi:dTDP-4-dehydrorhamnose 3,5-epimerase-like enzyme|tara:strand:+ start:394 stop:807 length:414 start_codon:yes stop_codon:yes gene_type:complete